MTEFTYKDYTFYISPMEPFAALTLLGDLQKIAFAAIGDALSVDDKKEKENIKKMTIRDILSSNIDIGKGIKTFSESLPGTLLATHMKTILNPECISVKSIEMDSPVKLDKARQVEVFRGNLYAMMQVAKKILEVNYKDFLDEISLPTGFLQESDEEEKTLSQAL